MKPDKQPSAIPEQRFRPGRLLLLCGGFAIASISLVAATGERDLLAIGALGIMLSGWLFSGWGVLLTVAFLYVANAVFMSLYYPGGSSHEEFLRGLVAYGFFLGLGLVVAKLRSMSDRIKRLNRELWDKNQELAELSLHDHLTRLYNRRYVNEVVFELADNFLNRLTLPEAQRRDVNVRDKVIAVFMVDVDDFKSINDAHGHAAGDRVLVEISNRLRASVRFDDVVARWGGEEFLVVCPTASRDSVGIIVQKLFERIRREEYELSDRVSIPVTVSIGCSYYPLFPQAPDAYSFEDVISVCDAALYQSKQTGRNRATYVVPRADARVPQGGRAPIPFRALIQDRTLFTVENHLGN